MVPSPVVQDVGLPLSPTVTNRLELTIGVTVIVKTRVIVTWIRPLARPMSPILSAKTGLRSPKRGPTKPIIVRESIVSFPSGPIDPKTVRVRTKRSF